MKCKIKEENFPDKEAQSIIRKFLKVSLGYPKSGDVSSV